MGWAPWAPSARRSRTASAVRPRCCPRTAACRPEPHRWPGAPPAPGRRCRALDGPVAWPGAVGAEGPAAGRPTAARSLQPCPVAPTARRSTGQARLPSSDQRASTRHRDLCRLGPSWHPHQDQAGHRGRRTQCGDANLSATRGCAVSQMCMLTATAGNTPKAMPLALAHRVSPPRWQTPSRQPPRRLPATAARSTGPGQPAGASRRSRLGEAVVVGHAGHLG